MLAHIMGNSIDRMKPGDEVIIGIKDLSVIEQMQQGHGGWSSGAIECLEKPSVFIQGIGNDAMVKAPSGNVYRLNSDLLIKYTKSDQSNLNIVQIIRDGNQMKQLQVNHGEWHEDMVNLLGQNVEIVKYFQDGDVKVKHNNKLWTINPKCIAEVNVKQAMRAKKGDTVKLKENIEEIKKLQENHGGWSDIMTLIVGQDVEIVEIFDDGDCYVSKHNMEWLVNPKCFDNGISTGQVEKIELARSNLPPNLGNLLTTSLINQISNLLTIDDSDSSNVEGLNQPLFGLLPAIHSLNDIEKTVSHTMPNRNERSTFDYEARINTRIIGGNTVLHLAVQANKLRDCSLFLNNGADVNLQNDNKMTPIMIAAQSGYHDILDLLLYKDGADINLADSDGDTALHLAIHKLQVKSVEILVNAGADILAVNDKQFNACHLATLKGDEKYQYCFI